MKRAGQRGSQGHDAGAHLGETRGRGPSRRPRAGALLIGAASALLVPFACGVDHRPPALSESDSAAASTSAGSSGNGGAGAAGGGGNGAGAGPASACECAFTAFGKDDNACSFC